jgi:hypothetical protein
LILKSLQIRRMPHYVFNSIKTTWKFKEAQTDRQAELECGLSLFGTGNIGYKLHRGRLKTNSFFIDSHILNDALVEDITPPPCWGYSRNPIFLCSTRRYSYIFSTKVYRVNIFPVIEKLIKK